MSADTHQPHSPADELRELEKQWAAAWPDALAAWSRYTQLTPPRWCFTPEEEHREHLAASFAMIRLVDHAVVISLRQVHAMRLAPFARQILAHEIGHHVYCPADLSDNARMLARARLGLPSREVLAPTICNLYTDLLINDRLHRSAGLDMAAVYHAIDSGSTDRLWTLYMRMYEILWSLPRASLAHGTIDKRLENDATLGARLLRSYARDWLDGVGRFACLCLPYVLNDKTYDPSRLLIWSDTATAGKGGFPTDLIEIDDAELNGAIHPADDPEISGADAPSPTASSDSNGTDDGHATITGLKTTQRRRGPIEYADLLRASGTVATEEEIVVRYYRELAMPHLIPFPSREQPRQTDPLPEGLDLWDLGNSLDDIDWLGTVTTSPIVIPGITTRQRHVGDSPGNDRSTTPLNLYLGVDCSGSMGHPAHQLSYPVLAGAIVALSALRAGASVKVVLSGEPGKTISTDGFLRDEHTVLLSLTRYLGTGNTFGIHRLTETYAGQRTPQDVPSHVLIVTDNDIFNLLDSTNAGQTGWDVAASSLRIADGGGTMVLQLPAYLMQQSAAKRVVHPGCERLAREGWTVSNVDSMEGLVSFARQFAHRHFDSRPTAEVTR